MASAPPRSDPRGRTGRSARSRRRGRIGVLAALVAVAVAWPVSAAAETVTPTPSPSPSSPSSTDARELTPVAPSAPATDASAPPTSPAPTPDADDGAVRPTPGPADDLAILSPADDAFVGSERVTVAGRKPAGSGVAVATSSAAVCTVAASSATDWACTGPVPNGRVTVTAALTDASADAASVVLRVLGPPSVASGGDVAGPGVVSGAGWPGSRLRLIVQSTDGALVTDSTCAAPVSGDGSWSCRLPSVADGRYLVQAQQGAPTGEFSDASAAAAVVVDRTPPPAPIVLAPASGASVSSVVEVTGTGEPGSLVQVNIDDVLACVAEVDASGAWGCRAEVGNGVRQLRAIPLDQVGNHGSPTAPVRFTVSGATGGPSGGPSTATPSPSGSPTPGRPQATPDRDADDDAVSGGGDDRPGDGGTGDGGTGDDGSPTAPDGTAAPRPEGGGGAVGGAGGWAAPSGFGSSLPAASAMTTSAPWVAAGLAAIAFLALIALPAKLLLTAASGRLRSPTLLGRNQRKGSSDWRSSPMTLLAGGLALALAVTTFTAGVDGEVRYVRLVTALALAFAVVNVAGVQAVAWVMRRVTGATVLVRVSPPLLVLAAGSALVAALLQVEHPVLVGVMLLARVANGSRRARAALAGAQLGAIALLTAAAWIAHGALPAEAGSFGGQLTHEVLVAIATAGAGSLLALIPPVRSLPGGALYDLSPLAWGASALAAVTVATALLASGAGFPVEAALLLALGFAAVGVGAWVWLRYASDPVG